MAIAKLPLIIVSGFSSSGKTSLIQSLRKSLHGRRLLCLYEDGEREILEEIQSARTESKFDLAFIECSPENEPFFVVEKLSQGDGFGSNSCEDIVIDTLITVVDAARFQADIFSSKSLDDLGLAFHFQDNRSVAEVLIEQVEFADVIVINKVDLVGEKELLQIEALLNRLNPRARKIRARHGDVAPEFVTETELFDSIETDEGAGWLAELQGEFDGLGETCGVTSFTYVENQPFHPSRFRELLDGFAVSGLVRAKGTVWIASRHHEIGVWSVAGRTSTLSYGGAWFAATPAREWPEDRRERAEIMRDWVAPFGDRRQEIAFIGLGLDEREIRKRLKAALMTPEEMRDGPDGWYAMPDPLPDWHVDADPEF